MPATVHARKKGKRVEGRPNVSLPRILKAGELTGWKEELRPNQPLRPLWFSPTDPDPQKGLVSVTTEPASGFIDRAGLEAFLSGRTPDEKSLHKSDDFYGLDTRTGIGVNGDTFAADDGDIYGIRFLSLKGGIGFYAEIDLPDLPEEKRNEVFAGIQALAFGGEGKRVAVRTVEPFDFPKPPGCEGKQKRFLPLATPAVAHANGEPYLPENCVAAAVNSPIAISGWDIAKGGPKPTRFASPAGSVYFLDSTEDVPEPDDEFGYGCHLQGVWTDG